MIDLWGGWKLLQDLLVILNTVTRKHNVSIANVTTRFILDNLDVTGVIIGVRLGIAEHKSQNARVFLFQLDKEDNRSIKSITSRLSDLFETICDCGD